MDNQEVLDNLKFIEDDLEGILDQLRELIVSLHPVQTPPAKKGKKK